MKRIILNGLLGFIFVSTSFSAFARPRGEGGEIPAPYRIPNQTVELADGEVYQLLGRVVVTQGEPYLHVDLQAHGWLASQKRLKNPLYRIQPDNINWKMLEGEWVKVDVRAQAGIEYISSEPQYVIELKLLKDPIITSGMYRASEGNRIGPKE